MHAKWEALEVSDDEDEARWRKWTGGLGGPGGHLHSLTGREARKLEIDYGLRSAVFHDEPHSIYFFLKDGEDINGADVGGNTALHYAVSEDRMECAKVLLRYGANPNVANSLGTTPLHAACLSGNHEFVDLLLEAGADRHLKDRHTDTARDVAWRYNHERCLWLIDRYASWEAAAARGACDAEKAAEASEEIDDEFPFPVAPSPSEAEPSPSPPETPNCTAPRPGGNAPETHYFEDADAAPFLHMRVKILGLQGRQELNGKFGEATAFVRGEKGASNRYAVALEESGERLKVKPQNLVVVGNARPRKSRTASAAKKEVTAAGPWLLAHAVGDGSDGLHLAYSEDGVAWNAVNNGIRVLAPQLGKKLVGGLCVCKGSANVYHIIWATGGQGGGIGYVSTLDFVDFGHHKEQQLLKVPESSSFREVKSPSLFFEPKGALFHLSWASVERKQGIKLTTLFSATTKDFCKFSHIRELTPPAGCTLSEARLLHINGRMHWVAVDDNRLRLFAAVRNKADGDHYPFGIGSAGPYCTASGCEARCPSPVQVGPHHFVYYYGKACSAKSDTACWRATHSVDGNVWLDDKVQLQVPFGVHSTDEALRGQLTHASIVEVPRPIVAKLHEVALMMMQYRESMHTNGSD